MPRKVLLLVGLFLLPLITIAAPATLKDCKKLNLQQYVSAQVVRVVDGDTIKVSLKGTEFSIRMLSIDTPETKFQGKTQGEWGDRATAALQKDLISTQTVTLEMEGEKCDAYGRILAHVWDGDKNLNLAQMKRGLAAFYCISPNTSFCVQYGDALEKAMNDGVGWVSRNEVELPYLWRARMRNEEFNKKVQNIHGGPILPPAKLEEVPVWDRVFYMR